MAKDPNDYSTPIIGGLYEHYKGKHYRVHGMVRHSETLEELVYYEALYKNELGNMWVRPLKIFQGSVTVDGEVTPRFRYLNSKV